MWIKWMKDIILYQTFFLLHFNCSNYRLLKYVFISLFLWEYIGIKDYYFLKVKINNEIYLINLKPVLFFFLQDIQVWVKSVLSTHAFHFQWKWDDLLMITK